MPDFISPEAKEYLLYNFKAYKTIYKKNSLIFRMLQPNILRRIKFSDIRLHPWIR